MTSGESPSTPSATRIGGFALIGVGALAAAFGVATAVSGGAENTAGEKPPGAAPESSVMSNPPTQPGSPPPQAQLPPPQAQLPPPQAQVPPPQAQVPPRTDDGRPVPPGGALVPPGSADQGLARIVVRVYNNSTVAGLAHRAADDFRRAGYDVPEVGNYAAGRIYTTTVYFRPGTEEESQAQVVAARFGARLEPRFDGIEPASPGVIAIITNDYKGVQDGK
jgi:hypothetical protein